MFGWLKKNRQINTFDEAFIKNPHRDNWYQANSYYPLPFALITTVDEEGRTNIGPHSFTMPYGVITDYSLVLITRHNSNTAMYDVRYHYCRRKPETHNEPVRMEITPEALEVIDTLSPEGLVGKIFLKVKR